MPYEAASEDGALVPRDLAANLTVVVVDGDGRPVPGARVEVVSSERWKLPSPWTGTSRYTTDDEGRASVAVGLPPRLRSFIGVRASKDGVGTSGEWVFLIAWLPQELVLTLRPPARVRGVVLAADGRPVAGASVHVEPQGGVVRGRRPAPLETNGDGRFETTVDACGDYEVTARKGRHVSGVETVTPVPGKTVDVKLWWLGAFLARGTLVDADARPVARGGIELLGHGTYVTGPGGRFAIRLPGAGRYTLVGSAEGWCRSQPVHAVVDEASRVVEVTVTLSRQAHISGRVVDMSGRGLADVWVVAVPESREPLREGAPSPPRIHESARAWTDERGAFELRPVRPGASYRLVCSRSKDVRVVARRGVPAGTEGLTVRLAPEDLAGRRIAGEVVPGIIGKPVTSFRVRVLGERDDGGWARVCSESFEDEGGRFELRVAPRDARHRLYVGHSRSAAEIGAGRLTEPFRVPPEGIELRVVLPRPGSLEVTVLDAEGSPVPRAFVMIEEDDARPRGHGTALADRNGRVVFRGKEPGRYRIRGGFRADREERFGPWVIVRVIPAERTTTTVTVPAR